MTPYIFVALIFCVTSIKAQALAGAALWIDCLRYPGPCNTDCYGVWTAKKPDVLHRSNSLSFANANRRRAGCLWPSPCKNGQMSQPIPGEDSCDEYPYASSYQGGAGAVLRCTYEEQNKGEGSQLKNFFKALCPNRQECWYQVAFSNPAYAKYCATQEALPNDGHQYVYDGSTRTYSLHQPVFEDFSNLRREFLLEQGSKVLMLTRNASAVYDGLKVLYMDGDDVLETRVVRELHGTEKSPAFQPKTPEG